MNNTNKAKNIIKQICIAFALPVAMLIIMEILIAMFSEGHVINTTLDIKNLIRGAGIAATVAFALSMNLTSGRMDLSLGSQKLISTILGGLLATKLGLDGIWVLIFAMIFGIIFGSIVGILYVTLRIPTMVLGIGVACIYESIAFTATNGVGLRLVGTKSLVQLSNINFTIAVVTVIVIFITVLMNYTKFSYEFRAVRGSQKIASKAGINIFLNVALCYTLAGVLVAVSGVLEASFSGAMAASVGLTSNGSVMAHMFAMMIGSAFLSRYINQSVGIVSAAFALKIFGMGLAAFNLSDAMSSCVTMALFSLFLVYQANEYKFQQNKDDKKRIEEARIMKNARGIA